MKKIFLLLLMSLAICTLSCTQSQEPPPTSGLNVFVSIPPQADFVNRIGGDHVNVEILVEPGESPHNFEPTPKRVQKLAKTKIYFTIGLPFERALIKKINSPGKKLNLVPTDLMVSKLILDHTHDHGDSDVNHNSLFEMTQADPHIWLAPSRIKIQAKNILKGLIKADPEHQADFEANYQKFLAELAQTDSLIRQQLRPYEGRSFYVFHPSFGYFAKEYGLTERVVEIEGKTPTPQQLQQLVEMARADSIKTIFVQPQFDSKSAEVVAKAIGGKTSPLDPLAQDVLGNLLTAASSIAAALHNCTPQAQQ